MYESWRETHRASFCSANPEWLSSVGKSHFVARQHTCRHHFGVPLSSWCVMTMRLPLLICAARVLISMRGRSRQPHKLMNTRVRNIIIFSPLTPSPFSIHWAVPPFCVALSMRTARRRCERNDRDNCTMCECMMGISTITLLLNDFCMEWNNFAEPLYRV